MFKGMPAMLIAKFVGDVDELKAVYDRGHALIMARGGALPFGELRHHCATSSDALYIIGVWESAEHIRQRWASDEFRTLLESVGFPTEPTERTILDLHHVEPPL
jgi:quinol monooxygenase YgiN